MLIALIVFKGFSELRLLPKLLDSRCIQVFAPTTPPRSSKQREHWVPHLELMEDVDVKLAELQGLLHHDYGTFTHSTNVALYATLLAKKLDTATISNEDIAIGGLLHDLGKLAIDNRILNKPSKLDDRELRIIKKHPLEGFRRLSAERASRSLNC